MAAVSVSYAQLALLLALFLLGVVLCLAIWVAWWYYGDSIASLYSTDHIVLDKGDLCITTPSKTRPLHVKKEE